LSIVIDSNIFLRLAFEEPGWEHCGKLLDSVYSGEQVATISAIQLSELYTPFERTNDKEAKEKLATEIRKSRIKIRVVDEEIARLSAQIRGTEKTPSGSWLALADSIILATAMREEAHTLYTLDKDFSGIKSRVKITAPGMTIEEWEETYAIQKRIRKNRSKNA